MTLWEPVLGSAFGGVAAMLQLAATWSRAAVAARGGVGLAMATLPISIAGPSLCILAATAVSPFSGGMCLLGFWLLRSWMLNRLGCS